MIRFFHSPASATLAENTHMVILKKRSLVITIHVKEPAKQIASLNQTLLRTNRRMLNSEDLFNDPDTITDIETLMLLKEELSIIEKQPKKKSK